MSGGASAAILFIAAQILVLHLLLPWRNHLSAAAAAAAAPQTQSAAVKLLLQSTMPPGAESQFPANLSAPICGWKGMVRCSADGSVTGLFLEGRRLRGPIPGGALAPLASSLTLLSLFNNSLASPLPEDLSLLTRLRHLSLSSNAFRQRLPPHLWALFRLRRLDLSANAFESSPSLPSLSAFPSLSRLDLSRNQISGNLTSLLGHGSSAALLALDLSSNAISGELSLLDFGAFPSLTRLDLSDNRLSGVVPDSIANGTHLVYVDLSGNRLQGMIPAPSLSELRRLSHLDLSGNALAGNASELLSSPSLKFLNLSGNEAVLCDARLRDRFGADSVVGVEGCVMPAALSASLTPAQQAASSSSSEEERKNRSVSKKAAMVAAAAAAGFLVCVLVVAAATVWWRRRRRRRSGGGGGGRRRRRWRRSGGWPAWRTEAEYDKEEKSRYASGPFSFHSQSGPWSANVKNASAVEVVMFEKPLVKLTFADLLRATASFNREAQVSQGGLGPVYSALLPPDALHVSIKVLIEGRILTNAAAAAEFRHLSDIKHPNLVPLLGYCIVGEERLVIYEFMKNGGLHRWLSPAAPPPSSAASAAGHYYDFSRDLASRDSLEPLPEVASLPWPSRHRIALGLARALAFLHHGHSATVVHRDVKASNVMLDEDMEARLANTGLAGLLAGSSDAVFAGGSPGYAPPEYGQAGGHVSTMGDVYSYGVVLLELVTGKKPVGDVYEAAVASEAAAEEEEIAAAAASTGEESLFSVPPPAPAVDLASWIRSLMHSTKRKKTDCGGLYHVLDRRAECEDEATREAMVAALRIGYLCTAEAPSKRPTIQQVVGLLKDLAPGGAAAAVASPPNLGYSP